MILVTIEADNLEHLIRHDELDVRFFFFLNLYAMYVLLVSLPERMPMPIKI